MAAVLHDVLEDTPVNSSALRRQFGTVVWLAVDALTRRAHEDYFDYIRRCMENPIARSVKIADLKDNLDPSRKGATAPMRDKYQRALVLLLEE